MRHPSDSLDHLLNTRIQALALTLRPSTIRIYRHVSRRFSSYLHIHFPGLREVSELRRDPHLLGWFAWLSELQPPLGNKSRGDHLLGVRRLLNDLADQGHPVEAGLIRPADFPPPPRYLPRPLAPDEDRQLVSELRRIDDRDSNALLLLRFTGMRVGECMDLPLDCLRDLGQQRWAVHVPIGKLHTERLVPVDEDVRRFVARLLVCRELASPAHLAHSTHRLLVRSASQCRLYEILRSALADAARQAGCSGRVTLHRLRHTYATDMLRLGVSLPALMQLLGHKDIRMTLRYVQVTQTDLQREFQMARQNTAQLHLVPKFPLPQPPTLVEADLPAIRDSLAATRYLLDLFRLQLPEGPQRHKLRRLTQRLMNVGFELDGLTIAEK